MLAVAMSFRDLSACPWRSFPMECHISHLIFEIEVILPFPVYPVETASAASILRLFGFPQKEKKKQGKAFWGHFLQVHLNVSILWIQICFTHCLLNCSFYYRS